MNTQDIISMLPYKKPFLFVDDLIECDENHVIGKYFFNPQLDFYKGHFADCPVTPGVILIETMAQIGVVCMGICILGIEKKKGAGVVFTSAETEFLKPVYPGETVTVTSEKIYFRFGKLKCRAIMRNNENQEVCRGVIAGLIKNYHE